jgi:hypothetical protein
MKGNPSNSRACTMMLNEFEFNRVVGRIRTAWAHRDFNGALGEIEAVIDEVTPDMKAHCLLLRGSIMNDQGLSTDARLDWIDAIQYSRAGSFTRHCLEYEVGKSFENEDSVDNARIYYRSAIQTCAHGDEFAGNKALSAFLTLNGGSIPVEDNTIVTAAVEKSWRILELPGDPDFTDLADSVIRLAEGFSDKLRRIKEA